MKIDQNIDAHISQQQVSAITIVPQIMEKTMNACFLREM